MCHAETVSKTGVVLLEKSRLYLDLFNSDVSSVDILVTLWHSDRLSVAKRREPTVQNRCQQKMQTDHFSVVVLIFTKRLSGFDELSDRIFELIKLKFMVRVLLSQRSAVKKIKSRICSRGY